MHSTPTSLARLALAGAVFCAFGLAACSPQSGEVGAASAVQAASTVAAASAPAKAQTKVFNDEPPGPFTIEGVYPHAPKGATVRLYKLTGMGQGEPTLLASATVQDGRYVLEGQVDSYQSVRLKFADDANGYYTDFFLEPGRFAVEEPRRNSWVSGGTVNDTINRRRSDPRLQEIHRLTRPYEGREHSLSKAQLRSYMALDDEENKAYDGALRSVLDDASVPPRVKLRALQLMPGLESLGADERLKWIDRLEGELGTHPVMAAMRTEVAEMQARDAAHPGVTVGMPYVDVTVYDAAGGEHKLSDVVNAHKVVLLDFWNTWCAPCRAEFPNMRKTRETYHARGFEIVSINTDETVAEWQKTSKADQINWLNYYDRGGDQAESYVAYGVDSVPASYLIDAKTGTVVSKRLNHEELNAKLAQMLGGTATGKAAAGATSR